MNTGELSVLNCTTGDIRISFNKDEEKEVEKAKKMISDMLKRGYIIMAEYDGKTERVKKFDPDTCEYIIQELDEEETKKKGKRITKTTRKPLKGTKATGVAPTAGG